MSKLLNTNFINQNKTSVVVCFTLTALSLLILKNLCKNVITYLIKNIRALYRSYRINAAKKLIPTMARFKEKIGVENTNLKKIIYSCQDSSSVNRSISNLTKIKIECHKSLQEFDSILSASAGNVYWLPNYIKKDCYHIVTEGMYLQNLAKKIIAHSCLVREEMSLNSIAEVIQDVTLSPEYSEKVKNVLLLWEERNQPQQYINVFSNFEPLPENRASCEIIKRINKTYQDIQKTKKSVTASLQDMRDWEQFRYRDFYIHDISPTTIITLKEGTFISLEATLDISNDTAYLLSKEFSNINFLELTREFIPNPKSVQFFVNGQHIKNKIWLDSPGGIDTKLEYKILYFKHKSPETTAALEPEDIGGSQYMNPLEFAIRKRSVRLNLCFRV